MRHIGQHHTLRTYLSGFAAQHPELFDSLVTCLFHFLIFRYGNTYKIRFCDRVNCNTNRRGECRNGRSMIRFLNLTKFSTIMKLKLNAIECEDDVGGEWGWNEAISCIGASCIGRCCDRRSHCVCRFACYNSSCCWLVCF